MKDTRTQKELMLAGELYHSFSQDLVQERSQARRLLHDLNALSYEDETAKLVVLRQLLGGFDEGSPPWIEAPFKCDYGSNIFLGADVFLNFGCVFLDCNVIRVGSRCLFGPGVQLYTPGHPLQGSMRNGTKGPEFAKPITIGDDCWFGGNSIVLPGVVIGEGVVVGAGAVVTKDVPSNCVVAGNPAHIIRRLDGGITDRADAVHNLAMGGPAE